MKSTDIKQELEYAKKQFEKYRNEKIMNEEKKDVIENFASKCDIENKRLVMSLEDKMKKLNKVDSLVNVSNIARTYSEKMSDALTGQLNQNFKRNMSELESILSSTKREIYEKISYAQEQMSKIDNKITELERRYRQAVDEERNMQSSC